MSPDPRKLVHRYVEVIGDSLQCLPRQNLKNSIGLALQEPPSRHDSMSLSDASLQTTCLNQFTQDLPQNRSVKSRNDHSSCHYAN